MLLELGHWSWTSHSPAAETAGIGRSQLRWGLVARQSIRAGLGTSETSFSSAFFFWCFTSSRGEILNFYSTLLLQVPLKLLSLFSQPPASSWEGEAPGRAKAFEGLVSNSLPAGSPVRGWSLLFILGIAQVLQQHWPLQITAGSSCIYILKKRLLVLLL